MQVLEKANIWVIYTEATARVRIIREPNHKNRDVFGVC